MSFTLTGERDDIAGALALAARFVASHKSNPQLSQLRLRVTSKGDSFVEATDQRASIRTALWVSCGEEVDCLAHPDLANAVKAMPVGQVTITLKGTQLEVGGKGKSRYAVATLDAEAVDAFPGEEDLKWDDVQAVDASGALGVMEIATRFVAKKDDNPSLVGVNLKVVDDQLAVEATDGARLFHDRVDLPSAGFPFDEEEVLLPPRMISELGRVFPSGEVMFAATTNLFFARDPNGETLFASRRIGGKFPDVKLLTTSQEKFLRVPRQELADALDRMRTVVKTKPVQLLFKDKELKLTAKTGQGTAEEWIDLPEEADMSMAFNVDYLAEAVALLPGKELRMHVGTAMRPVKIDDSGERFVLLAPVKFQ